MKIVFSAIWAKIEKAIAWIQSEIVDFGQNLTRDLKSLRSLFNWIYLVLYVWLIWYAATHHKESINTAIMSTATIVTAIFTGYVWSKSKDKELENKNESDTEDDPDEDGASD